MVNLLDEVRAVKSSEVNRAVECLVSCYQEDPLSRYLIAGDVSVAITTPKQKKLEKVLYKSLISLYALEGGLIETVDDFSGLACWTMPGSSSHFSSWQIFRSGLWKLRWYMDKPAKERFYNDFLGPIEAVNKELTKDIGDYWYLAYLGVRPSKQGQGYGRKLLESVIRRVSRCHQHKTKRQISDFSSFT